MKKNLLILLVALTVLNQLSFGQIEENPDTTQSTIVKMYQDIEVFKRLKISGYLQAQYQLADSAGQKLL